jgi:hypothetical protein
MLDWYKIEFFFPNAFENFKKTMFPNVVIPSLTILSHYDIKKLYNFFDKNGVVLTVEMIMKNNWVYTITLNDGSSIVPHQDVKFNRESIEKDGFYECFRFLEKKLINKETKEII